MEITGRTRIETSTVKRTDRAARPAGKGFSNSEFGEASPAAGLTGGGPIAAVETLLALQGIEETPDQRSRVSPRLTSSCTCWTKCATGCSQAEFRGAR